MKHSLTKGNAIVYDSRSGETKSITQTVESLVRIPLPFLSYAMNTETSSRGSIAKAIKARLITILVWVAIIAVIFIIVSVNRANEAATEAKLASPNQSVRDNVVLQLAMNSHLIDALANTQDPNTNSDSPQNTESKKIYSQSADSMNRLIDSGRIPDRVAFSNLFMLYKDGDSKAGATLGLAKLAAKS
ncbi:MAG TPA: hypothetical protein VFW40_06765, partial [Capsulimonadaceae bacterium]|nr:hypothetical protein [Capsulimonadaceae bacterium]